ncbi:MAG: VCBS repeat-containing protein, partial [Planctomycetes bacterium]|nr:VCBS repeat-containing protein [Planctomycetota bacterium]
IDRGRVGGGLQIRTGDLNGDGRLDIAVAGKSGTYILLNEGF